MRTLEKSKLAVQHARCIEMRRELRIEISEFVLVHLTAGNHNTSTITLPGMLTDVSVSGLGIVLPREMKAGACFRVEQASGEPLSPTAYCVVHCHRMRGGLYAVGAKRCFEID